MPRLRVAAGSRIALLVVLFTVGCNLVDPAPAGDGGDDAGDGGGDRRGEGSADGAVDEASPEEGELLLVLTDVRLRGDRSCDLDGDGTMDNAVADLGSPGSGLLLAALNAATAGMVDTSLLGLHLPTVEDVTGPNDPSTTMAALGLEDVDQEPGDNFSGEEPFYADPDSLDPCGEPRDVASGVRLESGYLSAEESLTGVEVAGIAMRGVQIEGTVEPRGAHFRLEACAYSTARDLAAAERIDTAGEHTFLEQLLAGGVAVGVPLVPGLKPDVDVDGDGLEHFVLDEGSLIESCVDGDSTVIEGRDCWRDSRIADGFAFSFEAEGVAGRFAGREPGWQYRVQPGCDRWPPGSSYFEPLRREGGECAGLDEECDVLMAEPCCDRSHSCTATVRPPARCLAPCQLDAECSYGEAAGTCLEKSDDDFLLCAPIDGPPAIADPPCDADERAACTTVHGQTDDTVCVTANHGRDTVCLERCPRGQSSCPEGAHCELRPVAFVLEGEPNGICVPERYWP